MILQAGSQDSEVRRWEMILLAPAPESPRELLTGWQKNSKSFDFEGLLELGET